jgi:hypothetical protein
MLDGVEKTWNPDRPAFFYVIDRQKGGVVAKYKVTSSFMYFS